MVKSFFKISNEHSVVVTALHFDDSTLISQTSVSMIDVNLRTWTLESVFIVLPVKLVSL